MREVGIRGLKQNASAVIADVVAGEVVTITDRGRPVARLVPIAEGPLAEMRRAGLVRERTRIITDLGPGRDIGASLSADVIRARGDERY
jgi:prevent-host-death family protein